MAVQSKAEVAMIDIKLEDFARMRVRAVLGSKNTVTRVGILQAGPEQSVRRLTLSRPARRLVLNVAGPGTARVNFRQTAAALSLARAAGVPVSTVLAVDTSYQSGPWSYLLQEHVDGLEWRRLRRLLAPEQVRNALRVADPRQRATFLDVRDRKSSLFAGQARSTLCHDDLQHTNLILRPGRAGWQLAAVLDWDRAWAGPSESDIARMSFWDDMTGADFWEVYNTVAPPAEGSSDRALAYQLLWRLEYPVSTPCHLADTASVCPRLGIEI